MADSIDGIPFTHFGPYPSEFVINHNPELLLGETLLTYDNVMQFKQGNGQELPIKLVEDRINSFGLQLPNVDKSNIALVCLPASKKADNEIRFRNFSNHVCSDLGIQNGFDHLTIINEKDEKHSRDAIKPDWDMENDLRFDVNFFAGKKVILFDDIVTSKYTMRSFIT